jgi:GGDEF domain-containing protein
VEVFNVAQKLLAMSAHFEELAKTDPALREAMAHFRGKSETGSEEDKKYFDVIRQRMYLDKLTNGVVGNHAAYTDESEAPDFHTKYIHVRSDGNDHKAMNDNAGYDQGDLAIRNYANVHREAADAVLGKGTAKIYRLGGDEFHTLIPKTGDISKDHARAAHYTREITKRLGQLVPIAGRFNHSLKIGIAHTADKADEAVREHAKKTKNAMRYAPGQAKTHVHSLLPGHEGAIPLDNEFDLI